ncbi:hypothetical protein PoB_003936900 [Plakobranchus ocellatus]|uniref:Uncharacterized protein n=1 Tax=Plakobranchus ocellatus TaxID=259542 RepID=A0AAV4B2G8_9GAST|nr:hypothetical protein PoB_003936900 [Plakobranchus ocellatus]
MPSVIEDGLTFKIIPPGGQARPFCPKIYVETSLKKCVPAVNIIFILFFKPEGPQKPSLKVYYHEPPSTILVNEELVAYCIACLGVYSTITWRIFNASDEPVTNENLLGSLTLKEKNTKGNLRIVFLYNIVSGANRPCVKILTFYKISTV